MRTIALAVAASFILISGANAASIDRLKGDVMIGTKKGYAPVKASAQVGPHQRVLVKAGGLARVMCSPTRFFEMAGPGSYKVPADCGKAPSKRK